MSDRRRNILKIKRTSERNTRQAPEETNDEANAMECHVVWITYMCYKKRRYKKTVVGLRNVNTEKNGQIQLN